MERENEPATTIQEASIRLRQWNWWFRKRVEQAIDEARRPLVKRCERCVRALIVNVASKVKENLEKMVLSPGTRK